MPGRPQCTVDQFLHGLRLILSFVPGGRTASCGGIARGISGAVCPDAVNGKQVVDGTGEQRLVPTGLQENRRGNGEITGSTCPSLPGAVPLLICARLSAPLMEDVRP
jgi:hypothetical protein